MIYLLGAHKGGARIDGALHTNPSVEPSANRSHVQACRIDRTRRHELLVSGLTREAHILFYVYSPARISPAATYRPIPALTAG
jgi:hypothetical protein